jgi:endonuclease/exonuclease/phosphatase family metal-dependent hydrolase
MTWNVHQPSERTAVAIAEEIIRLGADTIGLQEIGEDPFTVVLHELWERSRDESWTGKWVSESGRTACWVPYKAKHQRCRGIAIVTRLPVGDAEAWRIEPNDSNRHLQRLVVGVGDRRVLFYNTHLTDDEDNQATRDKQVRFVLARIAEDVEMYGLDVKPVLVGDLNARPWHCAMRDLRAAGFHDAWGERWPEVSYAVDAPLTECHTDNRGDEICGYHPKPFDARCGFTFRGKRSEPYLRLDYVYGGPGTTASDPDTAAPADSAGKPLSDHLAVLATIGFVGESSPGTSDEVLVPYGATSWTYAIDDGEPREGKGAFGSGGYCTVQDDVATAWPVDSRIEITRDVQVEPGTRGLTVRVVVDNAAQVYWNGVAVGSQANEGCPSYDHPLVVELPVGALKIGSNQLVVSGEDHGDQSFLDVQVAAAQA